MVSDSSATLQDHTAHIPNWELDNSIGTGGGYENFHSCANRFPLLLPDHIAEQVRCPDVHHLIMSINRSAFYGSGPLYIMPGESVSTEFWAVPRLNRMDEATAQFVGDNKLWDSVLWLQEVALWYLDEADFEIDILPAKEEEDDLLALRVYASFGVMDFRDRQRRLRESMVAAGHVRLNRIISIFQRSDQTHGRKALP